MEIDLNALKQAVNSILLITGIVLFICFYFVFIVLLGTPIFNFLKDIVGVPLCIFPTLIVIMTPGIIVTLVAFYFIFKQPYLSR